MTQREIIIKELKKGWLSNFKAILLVMSASADREIRRIRETPPEGFKLIERTRKEPCYHKQFKLEVI